MLLTHLLFFFVCFKALSCFHFSLYFPSLSSILLLTILLAESAMPAPLIWILFFTFCPFPLLSHHAQIFCPFYKIAIYVCQHPNLSYEILLHLMRYIPSYFKLDLCKDNRYIYSSIYDMIWTLICLSDVIS